MKRLTQAEVEALPVGTRVFVKWTGGSGPYWYVIRATKWGNRTINSEIRGNSVIVDIVSSAYIGLKPPFTLVEVEDE